MLLTFGHGTASAEQITELLQDAGVAGLVDVRTAPGSRRHPHVARAELEHWLPEAGISYRWDKRLGGFRKPAPDSPDPAWRPISPARRAACRSATSCTTAAWRSTASPPACGCATTACSFTTRASRSCCNSRARGT